MSEVIVKDKATNLVLVDPKKFEIKEDQANTMTSGLEVVRAERSELVSFYKNALTLDIEDPNTAIEAMRVRKLIMKNRTQGIMKWHASQKEVFLRGGQFVDAIKRSELAVNEKMEADLLAIEKHQENLEKERIEKLQNERAGKLIQWEVENIPGSLGTMDDEMWAAYSAGVEHTYNTAKENERIAEELRLKEEEDARVLQERREIVIQFSSYVESVLFDDELKEMTDQSFQDYHNGLKDAKIAFEKKQAEIEAENERLRLEAKANAEKAEAERKEREAKAEKERKEREEKEAAERAKREEALGKERAEAQRKYEAAQKEKNAARLEAKRVADELQARKDAEAQAEANREAARQAELQKGDADKLKDLINDLEALKTKYTFKSAKNQKAYADTGILLDKVIAHVRN